MKACNVHLKFAFNINVKVNYSVNFSNSLNKAMGVQQKTHSLIWLFDLWLNKAQPF